MPDVTRATAAAASIAASLGLPVTGTTVLHNSNKLALRLTPCDVFARVALVGQEVAQFEVDLAQRLAEAGCPVCPLEPRVDPRVYTRDGFAVTLWTYYEPVTPRVPPLDSAEALALLHSGMREVDVPSPRFTDRVAEAEAVVAAPERSPDLTDADRAFLNGRLASLRCAIEERGAVEQLLHGEPHPGNLLATKDGPLFIDLETCCRGPIEFDLAHVSEEVCEHYPNIDQGLLDECRQLVLAMVAAWRWELGDEFPNGRRFGEALLRALRGGPPWPTLDTLHERLGPVRDRRTFLWRDSCSISAHRVRCILVEFRRAVGRSAGHGPVRRRREAEEPWWNRDRDISGAIRGSLAALPPPRGPSRPSS